VITDGRRECIERAIPSALTQLRGDIGSLVICDDSGDPVYQRWLRSQWPEFTLICAPGRVGYTQAMQRVWAVISELPDEWIWQAEDDFTLDQPIDLDAMISVLSTRPELAQIALLRQPWFGNEVEHGGLIEALEAQGNQFRNVTDGHHWWVQHRALWTGNPSLFRREIASIPWPNRPYSESAFGQQLIALGYEFAYWGKRRQLCTHIGTERAGHGY